MVKRVVVGAHYGLRDWLMQRIAALIMAAYLLVLPSVLMLQPSVDFTLWKSLFTLSWFRIFTAIFFLALLLHAWVGMREILMDYIQHAGLKLLLLVAVMLSLITYGIWTVQILWGS